VASKRELIGLDRQHFKIRRQSLGSRKPSRNSDKEVLVIAVQTRKRPNGVASVGPHAELANTPDVDRDPHDTSVNRTARKERPRVATGVRHESGTNGVFFFCP